MKKEIEAKFLSIDKHSLRDRLEKIGFELKTPEYMMRRKTFAFPGLAPGIKKWGRVRQESDKVTMTIKEIRGGGIHDVYEIELVVNDFDIASKFFVACDVPEQAFQENLREAWKRDGIEVTIDTWPGLQPFTEVEGPNEKIVKEISLELGFEFDKAVFGSIDLVYEKELGIPSETIIRLPKITFANPPKIETA